MLLSITEVGAGCVRGLGKAFFPTAVNLLCQGILPVIWCIAVFPAFLTLEALFLAYAIFRALSAIIQTVHASIVIKNKERSLASYETEKVVNM